MLRRFFVTPTDIKGSKEILIFFMDNVGEDISPHYLHTDIDLKLLHIKEDEPS